MESLCKVTKELFTECDSDLHILYSFWKFITFRSEVLCIMKKSNTKEQLVGVTENSIDMFSTIIDSSVPLIFEGLPNFLKSFPVTNFAMQILKTATSISNLITVYKYANFIEHLNKKSIPEKKWNEFLNKCNKDKYKFSEDLLFAIDRADCREKATIIAEFVNEFMNENISYDDMLYFIGVINSMPLSLLRKFSKDYKSKDYFYDQSIYGFLNANGFINMLDGNGNFLLSASRDLTETYKLSDKAKKFGEILEKYFDSISNSSEKK